MGLAHLLTSATKNRAKTAKNRGQGNSVKTRQSGPSEGEDVRNLEMTVVRECKLQASRADVERFERVQRTFSNSRPDQQTGGSTAMALA